MKWNVKHMAKYKQMPKKNGDWSSAVNKVKIFRPGSL